MTPQAPGKRLVAFLAGVMRSVKEQYWRQARKGARQLPKLLVDLGPLNHDDNATGTRIRAAPGSA
jgi:hypothetical protein